MKISFDASAHRERKVRLIITVKTGGDDDLNDLGTFTSSIYVEEPIKYWRHLIPNHYDFNSYCEYLQEYCQKVNKAFGGT